MNTERLDKRLLDEVMHLPEEDRMALAEAIWESVLASETEIKPTEEEKRILDQRLAAYEKNPNRGIPLDEAMQQLREKHVYNRPRT
jgi:putative addiction module component (TIGR02574 family)